MFKKSLHHLRSIAVFLSRPVIIVWTLPPLMLLLIIGTVAQREMGLYAAIHKYFSGFVTWLGPIPFPGAFTLIGIIAVSLLAKFILDSRWSWRNSGIILTHFGALLLLFGGLLTAATQREGYMPIPENEESALVQDYHLRQLTVTEDGAPILTLDDRHMKRDRTLPLPFSVKVTNYMRNGTPSPRTESAPAGLPLRGPAEKVNMLPAPPDIQDENNHSAITLHVTGTDDPEQDGIYLLTEIMPHQPVFEAAGKTYQFRFGKAQRNLPFAIRLDDVERDLYPGTEMAREYTSRLTIIDQGATWPAQISMNKPLRYKGYTFFQSGYEQNEKGEETTILSVVTNTGRLFPYISTIIMAAGLILHLILRSRGAALMLTLLALTALPQAAHASTMDMAQFDRIPILHDGRVKPMGSFALAQLRLISGENRTGDLDASAWLAETLFDPATAAQRRIFPVRDAELLTLLDLPVREGKYYSFSEIGPGLYRNRDLILSLASQDDKDLTETQKKLLTLQSDTLLMTELMRSLTLMLPLENGGTYLSRQGSAEDIKNRLKAVIRKKGNDIMRYTDAERALAQDAFILDTVREGGRGNAMLRVIPDSWSGGHEWYAPWALLEQGLGSPATVPYMEAWQAMAAAWQNGDNAAWIEATAQAASLAPARPLALTLELIYTRLHPFHWTSALYACAALFMAAALRQPRLLYPAVACGLAGILLHGAAVATRIYVLERPPVGTLYESLLFVSLVCAAFGIMLFRNRLAFAAAVTTAMVVLMASIWFAGNKGDTMEVLVAVLNTSFWLGTHVICITLGYGFSLLAGGLAHLWLALPRPGKLYGLMHRTALAALLFTAVGTILGGIWADQSWGRFWGWDPKENGALLIVLWLVWAFHGKLSGAFSQTVYAAMLALTNIVVALSWFGVNLLGTGLHSYGFISGIALGLFTFCAVELLLIGGLYVRKKSRAA